MGGVPTFNSYFRPSETRGKESLLYRESALVRNRLLEMVLTVHIMNFKLSSPKFQG